MNITDKAKEYIQEIMNEQGAKNIKIIMAGMG
jgi:Fe-S cluster assembly iron-binding protein IscA